MQPDQIRAELRTPLVFWINPGGESPRHRVDLTEFAFGAKSENLRPQSRRRWRGDFGGRPQLAAELVEYFQSDRPTRRRAAVLRFACRTFYRFLHDTDPELTVLSSEEVNDWHGASLIRWMDGRSVSGHDRSHYVRIRSILTVLRSYKGLPRLFWPVSRTCPTPILQDIDDRGVRQLFEAFKGEARQIKNMLAEGRQLAVEGQDPREIFKEVGSAAWDRRENHAWLIRELTKDVLPGNQGALSSAWGFITTKNRRRYVACRPMYRAPTMSGRSAHSLFDKLRWFHLSIHETAIFLWMFLISTGWNLCTALSLDVTTDADWFEPHLQKPELMVLHGFKTRSDRHQFAICSARSEWSPYRVVLFMLENTKVLRNTLQCRITALMRDCEYRPSPELEAEIAQLKISVKSPWLFHQRPTGRVRAFEDKDAPHLNDVVRALGAKSDLFQKYPSVAHYTTSDMRDAWIGHAYRQSGYNVLIARLAAQHKDLRTLRSYLNRRRYKAHSEDQVRKVQCAAYKQIQGREPLDPTSLHLLVLRGEITEDQSKRLQDYRQRTRLGMGCLDPCHPPKAIAPGHQDGQVCRVQRCLGCSHGVLFADSLDSLSRVYAELITLKTRIPFVSWVGSSFEQEEISLSEALTHFDATDVKAAVDRWLDRFRRGEAVIHDVYPSY